MDTTTCSNVTEDDYGDLKISILRSPTRERLSCMLNGKKVLASPENLPRDWRGVCTLLNYTIPSGCDPSDPIGKIFKFCELKTTIAHFIQCLERIDRYDVLEETRELIASDILSFKKRQCSVVNDVSEIHNNDDVNIITLDDINASNNGLPLQRYDAFLLYDNADINSASIVVDKLEKEFNLKLCLKDRDLRPGVMFEYQSIIRLISDRCNWLITIVSNNFLNSPWNRFIMNYTQTLAIEERIPKIIPCVFDDCKLPQELKYYVHLFFNKNNPFLDPWNKLRITLAPLNNKALTNDISSDNSHQELRPDQPINNTITIVEQKDKINISKGEVIPPKKKNVMNKFVKTVGNLSIKVVNPKYNKNKTDKSKTKVMSL